MKISPARLAAFGVLRRIEKDRSYSSVLLSRAEEGLAENDRRLCHNLVLGTLRTQLYLDEVINILSRGKKLDIEVRIALRLGLYQLRELSRVPAYSVVNESINLVQRAGKSSAKGFVNAILRKASVQMPAVDPDDPIERLQLSTSHPRWMLERWAGLFGPEAAEAIAKLNNTEPPVAFRVLRASTATDDLINASRPSALAAGCWIADAGTESLAYQLAGEGMVYIQNEASQMVAHLAFAGTPVLDVCASPGGKTGILAALGGTEIVAAGDLHSSRVDLLKTNLGSQGVRNASVVQYDAEFPLPFERRLFRSVLVDAPCTGTGTIRHNPEIRYFLRPENLAALPAKQLAILRNASKLVGSGGRLTYSTCSLEPEEDEAVARAFLEHEPEFRLRLPEVPAEVLTNDGYVRTWPHVHGSDGFFAAQFVRG